MTADRKAAEQKSDQKRRAWRTITQLAALLLFAGLTAAGKLQLWFIVFVLFGLAASFFFGRIYCGWICPMGTVLRAETWLYEKMHIDRKRFRTPSWMHSAAGVMVRWTVLVLFFGIMVMMQRQGRPVPILLYLTAAAALVSLFFEEAFWHRQLCPFGTLLSVTGRTAKKQVRVDQTSCIACGKCDAVCPTHSIHPEEPAAELRDSGKKRREKRMNTPNECLICTNCMEVCPTGAITYE